MASSSCNRVDIVKRGNPFDESGVKNSWRWEWCDKVVNDTRAGVYIRKLEEPGLAYCCLCRKEIAYSSKGFAALNQHLTREGHKGNLSKQQKNQVLPGE